MRVKRVRTETTSDRPPPNINFALASASSECLATVYSSIVSVRFSVRATICVDSLSSELVATLTRPLTLPDRIMERPRGKYTEHWASKMRALFRFLDKKGVGKSQLTIDGIINTIGGRFKSRLCHCNQMIMAAH